ncbi:MAG: PAS domain S-box protein [Desulfopila sp.]
MFNKLITKIKSRVTFKLALWGVVFSVCITLLASGFQLYLVYQKELATIEQYCDSLTGPLLSGLSEAVRRGESKYVQAHLINLTSKRDITYAAVHTADQKRWQSGYSDGENTVDISYDLVNGESSAGYGITKLKMNAALDPMYERLRWAAMNIFLVNGMKIFLFAGGLLLLFQYTVTRHLEKLAEHVVTLDYRRKIVPLRLDRESGKGEDEFCKVVAMLNLLQRRGHNAFKALKKSEDRLRLFFDATEEGIFGINAEGRITFVNATCLDRLGVEEPNTIIGRKVEDLMRYSSKALGVMEDDTEIFLKPLHTGKSLIIDEGLLHIAGGASFHAAVRTYPLMMGERTRGAVVFVNDITEQREIFREKNLLSQAVRQSPMAVVVFDSDGNIEYVNPGYEKLTGYALRDVIGEKIYYFGHHKKNRMAFRDMRDTLYRKEKWQGIVHLRSRYGDEYSLDTLVAPVVNSRGDVINIIALCLDITQKEALQNQLLQAQKMEAVGRLSASFAHEFGNPLLGVRSVIKDISDRISMDHEDKELLELAYRECDRMKNLIRDFQQFQRSGSNIKANENVHEIIDDVLRFYSKHFEKSGITVERHFNADVPLLHVSKNQIAQVFLNLIINAVDAMADDGGRLKITTSMVGNEVLIDLKDSGPGISEMEKGLIFEPFYTTKSEVQGTGLGLSVSYGIISSHGGEITVDSAEDGGARFTVKLPMAPGKN